MKKKLTLNEFAKITYMDSSNLSRLENGKLILSKSKIQSFLPHLGFNNDFLLNLEADYDQSVYSFLYNIIEVSSDCDLEYLKLKYQKYTDTIFSLALSICDLAMASFHGTLASVKQKEISYIENNNIYLNNEMKCFSEIYLGRWYHLMHNYPIAKKHFDSAKALTSSKLQYAYLEYFLSLFYLENNDLLLSTKSLDAASKGFLECQAYPRLINTNIILAMQYREIGLYKKALETDLSNLRNLQMFLKPLEYEKMTLINNIAWTYFLLNDYTHAIEYYEQIPLSKRTAHHSFDLAYCYYMNHEYEKASNICMSYNSVHKNELYASLLRWLQYLILENNFSKSAKGLKILLSVHAAWLNKNEKLYLLSILKNIYQENNQFSQALRIANEIIALK